jgi:hypothetical protein
MAEVTTRRKLVDVARAQTDEIEFMRQELDRLRQRTFPSFGAYASAPLRDLLDAPTALAACCGFDLCHTYILYLYLYLYLRGRNACCMGLHASVLCAAHAARKTGNVDLA